MTVKHLVIREGLEDEDITNVLAPFNEYEIKRTGVTYEYDDEGKDIIVIRYYV